MRTPPFIYVLATFIGMLAMAVLVDWIGGGGVFLFGGEAPGTWETIGMVAGILAVVASAFIILKEV
jgi:hypothetical protein